LEANKPNDKIETLINIYNGFGDQCNRISEFYDSCRVILPPGSVVLPHLDKPSESLLAKMSDHILKWVYLHKPVKKELIGKGAKARKCPNIHTPVKKELRAKGAEARKCPNIHTAVKKELKDKAEETMHTVGEEGTQVVVVPAASTGEAMEEKLLITWWDEDDDLPPSKVDLGSAKTNGSSKDTPDQDAAEGDACNDWQRTLDYSINPFCNQQPERSVDLEIPSIGMADDTQKPVAPHKYSKNPIDEN